MRWLDDFVVWFMIVLPKDDPIITTLCSAQSVGLVCVVNRRVLQGKALVPVSVDLLLRKRSYFYDKTTTVLVELKYDQVNVI